MSDFGASVMVYRSDRQPTTSEDEHRVAAAARSLQFVHRDKIGPYDEFDFRFGGASDVEHVNGINIGLTGYFIGDEEGNDGLDPDVIIAREEPIAQQFAEDLARVLGSAYRIEHYSGYW